MTKNSYILFCTGLLLVLITSCHRQKPASVSFDNEVYTPRYASGFNIKGSEGKKSSLITITDPWQGADGVTTQFFIARNGEKAPEGFEGGILTGEARRIVAMSSSHIAMLDALGETDRIVGVSGINYLSTPSIKARRDKPADVGYGDQVDYERMLSLRPDVVLVYGINSASAMENKLRELHIPYIYIGEYLETSPLGKAEWAVLLGELTGKRREAERIVGDVATRYNALARLVTDSKDERPKVMLNAPYGDSWFMPPVDSYMVRLIEDAGADYLLASNKTNTSVPIDREEAYLLSSEASVWLNAGSFSSLAEVRKALPQWASLRVVRTGQIYNNTARMTPDGGNDFFESGCMRPDVILRDLIQIFHPTLLDRKPLEYYRQLH